MKLFFLLLSIFLSFLFPQTIFADEGWVIDNFKSDIVLKPSGELRVVETISADFLTKVKHGIYRDIPYVYQIDGQKTYTQINIESIYQNKQKATYDTTRNEGYIRLKIGDSDKTVTGKNSYVITYSAKGVLRSFEDHDELYWNVTGNNWPVAISHAQADIAVPKEKILKIICYEGYANSQSECLAKQLDSKHAIFQTLGVLDEAKGLTVAVGYTKGMVPIVNVERPKSFWEKFIAWPSLATLFIIIFAGIGTVFYRWYIHGRDYWFGQNIFGKKEETGFQKPIGGHETISVEFTPPDKLRPAEMGVLLDERADTHDIVATIIDLASRGFLTITEIPKKWIFGKVDYQLEKKANIESDLLGYEKVLLHNLFKSAKSVKVSDLKTTFYDDLKEVKKELYKEVVAKKLFPSDPEHVRGNYIAIGIIFIIIGGVIIGSSISADIVLGADLAVGLIVSGIMLAVMARFMPRKTAYGRDLYRRVKGYYLFINTAEKHRQIFFEKKNMFNEILPYAIAFGLTAKFAKQMQSMGIQPSQVGWYSGIYPLNIGSFATSMNDFSNSMSSAIASTPSSSGGFSGGSSGGGFGGGGGGSW